MIIRYLQLPIGIRCLAWSLLGTLILAINYLPRYQITHRYLQEEKSRLTKQEQKKRLQNDIIQHQKEYHTELNQLNINDAQLTIESLKKTFADLHLPAPTWQEKDTTQGQLILQGDLESLNQQWQLLSQIYIPWQLISYELTINNNNLQCVLTLTNQQTPDNSQSPKNMSANPFNQYTTITDDTILDLKTLHWLGALQSSNTFSAYALLSNQRIKRFDIGTIIGQEEWRVTFINLQHITFENKAHQKLDLLFSSKNN